MFRFKLIKRDGDFEAREMTTGLWEAGKTGEQALGKLVISLAAAGKVEVEWPPARPSVLDVNELEEVDFDGYINIITS